MDSDGITPVKVKICFRIFKSDIKGKIKFVVLYQIASRFSNSQVFLLFMPTA